MQDQINQLFMELGRMKERLESMDRLILHRLDGLQEAVIEATQENGAPMVDLGPLEKRMDTFAQHLSRLMKRVSDLEDAYTAPATPPYTLSLPETGGNGLTYGELVDALRETAIRTMGGRATGAPGRVANRAAHALWQAGLRSADAIATASDERFLRMKYMGPKALKLIRYTFPEPEKADAEQEPGS